MLIEFKNVIPDPLRQIKFDADSLWNTSFQLDCSKRYLLRSSSGKGKSTFVAYLFGSRLDYSGEVSIDGINWSAINAKTKSALRSKKLAIVPQDMRLFPKLTALQNLQLKNELEKAVPDETLTDLLIQVGLKDQIHQTCGTLSLGQQQRVAILRALIQPFEFLIMDEPFSHLDEDNIALMKSLIEAACDRNNAGFLMASLGSDYQLNINQTLLL